jgi:ferritin heavy chain
MNDVECNSKFGGFSVNESPVVDFMHSNVVNNFQFLLMSSHFSTYVYNREGFSKLYRQMADQAWNDAIELIKYTTKRGGTVSFGSSFNQLKISDEKVKTSG